MISSSQICVLCRVLSKTSRTGDLQAAAHRDSGTQRLGREVFERARCASSHAGPSLSNGRIIPAGEIGTQPARADALQSNARTWSQAALGYGFGQIAPFEGGPRLLEFQTDHLDPRADPARLRLRG